MNEKIFYFGIGNTYGNLEVKEQNGKYYWTVSEVGSDDWDEIPKSLFDELVKYSNSLD